LNNYVLLTASGLLVILFCLLVANLADRYARSRHQVPGSSIKMVVGPGKTKLSWVPLEDSSLPPGITESAESSRLLDLQYESLSVFWSFVRSNFRAETQRAIMFVFMLEGWVVGAGLALYPFRHALADEHGWNEWRQEWLLYGPIAIILYMVCGAAIAIPCLLVLLGLGLPSRPAALTLHGQRLTFRPSSGRPHPDRILSLAYLKSRFS